MLSICTEKLKNLVENFTELKKIGPIRVRIIKIIIFLWKNNKNKLVWVKYIFSINKPKMAQFSKFNLLFSLKFNLKRGQFYK